MSREEAKAIDAIATTCGLVDYHSSSQVVQAVKDKLAKLAQQLDEERAARADLARQLQAEIDREWSWSKLVRPWVELACEMAGLEPQSDGSTIPAEACGSDETMLAYVRDHAITARALLDDLVPPVQGGPRPTLAEQREQLVARLAGDDTLPEASGARYRHGYPEPGTEPTADALGDEGLSDLLSLVMDGHHPPPEQVAKWTPEQRAEAEAWAAAEHLGASDNSEVQRLPRPAWLPEAPRAGIS